MPSPILDDDLVPRAIDPPDRLLFCYNLQCVEDFSVEQFVPELNVLYRLKSHTS
ncbi:hypothetical protein SAMN05443582_104245 [Phyllobacterium sp. OV277]|nr:hypothetical protein SAMN05443582_104245 [Phyllobacterium sp. OV277]